MAISNYEYNAYLPAIAITTNGVDYTIPIWDLSLTVIPWSGGVGPAQELADGSFRQKVRGWHVVVDLSMNFSVVNTDDHCNATQMINNMYQGGTGLFDFDPVDNNGTRTLTLVLKDPQGGIQTGFEGKVRYRKQKLTLITQTPYATGAIPAWIAGD